ncbi:MAG: choice-of-anchor tandem repeat GloVer-containing protein [Verrucomicrobiota bacterium]|jgi:uncharacterized repeat protein (TIGR03803 family)
MLLVLPCAWAGVSFTSVYSLTGYTDATLVQSGNGARLYGTTVMGGAFPAEAGTVFVAPTNTGGFLELGAFTNVVAFTTYDGGRPYAGVIFGPRGYLYGTTAFYGISNTLFPTGMGSMFSLHTNSVPLGQEFGQLYRFGTVLNTHGQPLDGASPRAPLVNGPASYLYGTTYYGGTNGYGNAGPGYGTVFKITTNNLLTGLHSFAGADGANPTGLVLGSDTNIYGVTSFGGSNTTVVDTNGDVGFGTIFRITTNGLLTTLYSFGAVTNAAGNALDGAEPNALVEGSDGNFYGTTAYGGSNAVIVNGSGDAGYGTVFKIGTNGRLTSLYSFGAVTNTHGVALDGANPSGPLIEGADGNFFGVTQYGGTTNTGTIFRITPAGALTTLIAFGRTNAGLQPPGLPPYSGIGNYPRGGLMIAADGSFYGTTYAGGRIDTSEGTIYRIGPPAPDILNSLPTITVIAGSTNSFAVGVNSIYATSYQWQFDGTNLTDGGEISGSATTNLVLSGVTLADSGTYKITATNVAGTASASGVLTVVPAIIEPQPVGATIVAGASYVFTVGVSSVYPVTCQWQLDGTNLTDGGNISGSATSSLTLAGATLADTGFYSVVVSNAAGTVHSTGAALNVYPFLTTAAPSSLTVIAGSTASFALAMQSDYPMSYQWQFDGTNLSDGGNIAGSATSNLTVTAATMADAGTYTVVASNSAGALTNSGAVLTVVPFVTVTPPSSLTVIAGSGAAFTAALQSVYPMNYQWRFNRMNLSDGGNIAGSSTSNLTVSGASTANAGEYSLTASNGAGWTNWNVILSVLNPTGPGCKLSGLYSFSGGDGANPEAALVQGADGNFYGTTVVGGTYDEGTMFRVSAAGALATLYSFGTATNDGSDPEAALIQGSDGIFYGTTHDGGGNLDDGAVFSMTADGVLTNLLVYGIGNGGFQAGVLQGPDGLLYGGTVGGYVFGLTTNGGCTTLFSFARGEGLAATLAVGTDGNLYGVTEGGGTNGDGSVFETSTSGTLATLYSFKGGTDGTSPAAPLIQGGDGAFYGSAIKGGANGAGTVFRVTTNGAFSTLYSFGALTNWDGSALDGATPNGLLLANDGYFYGTTQGGGYQADGTVFRMTPDGAFSTLVFFDWTNGANPAAALVQGSDGALYGTTVNGGANDSGTIFRLTVPPAFRFATPTNGMISLAWSAVAGQTYQVQYTTDLTHPNWLNLGGPILAGGPALNITDFLTASQRFYRVLTQ